MKKWNTLNIVLSATLLTSLATFDVVAGRGGGDGASGDRPGDSGMPGFAAGSGGWSKGAGGGAIANPGGGGMSGPGGVSKGKASDAPFLERHRVGDKDDLGVRTREADRAK